MHIGASSRETSRECCCSRPLFWLPTFVAGGTLQAITHGWILVIVLWPIALLGAWIVMFMSHYASFEIRILPDGIEQLVSGRPVRLQFSSMTSLQPIVLRTPDWLILLSLLASASGKGSDGMRMAGQDGFS